MQACGLKLKMAKKRAYIDASRLMQACGLKLSSVNSLTSFSKSRLMQACGLKQTFFYQQKLRKKVTPHAGVWIETGCA